MVTDGGLVFYGSLNGDFRAVDRNSGKVLWSRKLGSGIVGNPMTYKLGGQAVRIGVCGNWRLDRSARRCWPRLER